MASTRVCRQVPAAVPLDDIDFAGERTAGAVSGDFGQLDQLPEIFHTHLTSLGFQLPTITVIGKGTTSRVIRILDKKGIPRVFMLPASGTSWSAAREAYRNMANVLDAIELRDEAARKRFPHLRFLRLEGRFPILEVEEARGSLWSDASASFGPKGQPHQQLSSMEQMADGIHELHLTGYVHGDIKPENFLTTDQRFGQDDHILVSDLESATPVGALASTRHTGAFIAADNGIHSRSAADQFRTASVERDTYALMLSYYNLLLGKSYLDVWPTRNERQITSPPLVSVHTLDPKIEPNLSIIAWTHFPNTEALKTAIAAANTDMLRKKGTPSRFLVDYYGPKVLATLSPKEAAAMIGSAAELLPAFETDLASGTSNLTGIPKTKMAAIQKALEELRKEQRVPASLKELLAYQLP